jgi:DNA-directed RNA polymerase subunit beta
VRVFARYTTVDLRDEERPTTVRELEEKQVLAFDVPDPETGELLVAAGKELSDATRKKLLKAGAYGWTCCFAHGAGRVEPDQEHDRQGPDGVRGRGAQQIYSLLRPGEAPNLDTARQALERLFFNPKRYDLGRVGRYKINQRLRLRVPESTTVLTEEDFIAIIRYLLELSRGAATPTTSTISATGGCGRWAS